MARVAFTAGRVSGFKCPAEKSQAFLWDSIAPGLGLRATPAGKSAYVFQGLFEGKTLRMTIGSPAVWGIPDAQAKARELQRQIDDGRELAQLRATTRIGAVMLCAVTHNVARGGGHLDEAIGAPGLPYVQSSHEENKPPPMEQSISSNAANQREAQTRWLSITAIGSAITPPAEVQPSTLETFACKIFVRACRQVVKSGKAA